MTLATADGTARYRARFKTLPDSHFRSIAGRTVSSLGAGTYLGREDDATDERYVEALAAAVRGGINVLDTAINYRIERSEKAVGRALATLVAGGIGREEVVVATKGGYIPSRDPAAYVKALVDAGVITPKEVAAGVHCIAPEYIRHQLRQSLANLGLDGVDVYYLHNPEQQLEEVDRREFLRRMRLAFEALEAHVAAGRVGVYGTATWTGYRVARGSPGWLSLEGLVQLARDVAGDGHHFRVVQAPLNLAMTEAYGDPTQVANGVEVALLDAAQALDIALVTSAPLLQGRLSRGLPAELQSAFPSLSTDAQRAVQFARSCPGVVTTLVGMSRVEHVKEALALAAVPPATGDQVRSLFSAG
ncbi:MAG TPA: aldo/keto reductase [Vicinamibacteria bacterium]|nr:aldo/keto reductase [Vicinamibacteria bacterium]